MDTPNYKLERALNRHPYLKPDNMQKIGFELVHKPESEEKGYYEFRNNATVLYNKDYNAKFPEPK
jgi:hypothetical protein